MKVNLLPFDQRPLKANVVRAGFLAVTLGVVGLVLVVGFGVLTSMQTHQLQIRHESLSRTIDFLSKQKQGVDALQGQVDELQAIHHRYSQLISPAVDLADGICFAVERLPYGLFAESVATDGGKVRIQGYTEELVYLARYIDAFERSAWKAAVEKVESHEVSGFTQFLVEVEGHV